MCRPRLGNLMLMLLIMILILPLRMTIAHRIMSTITIRKL